MKALIRGNLKNAWWAPGLSAGCQLPTNADSKKQAIPIKKNLAPKKPMKRDAKQG